MRRHSPLPSHHMHQALPHLQAAQPQCLTEAYWTHVKLSDKVEGQHNRVIDEQEACVHRGDMD